MIKAIKKKLANKYVSWVFNIGFIVLLIVSIEGGWYLWFLLISTIFLTVFYWHELYRIMKAGGELYASFCKEKSYQITKKVYKDYRNEEMEQTLADRLKEKK